MTPRVPAPCSPATPHAAPLRCCNAPPPAPLDIREPSARDKRLAAPHHCKPCLRKAGCDNGRPAQRSGLVSADGERNQRNAGRQALRAECRVRGCGKAGRSLIGAGRRSSKGRAVQRRGSRIHGLQVTTAALEVLRTSKSRVAASRLCIHQQARFAPARPPSRAFAVHPTAQTPVRQHRPSFSCTRLHRPQRLTNWAAEKGRCMAEAMAIQARSASGRTAPPADQMRRRRWCAPGYPADILRGWARAAIGKKRVFRKPHAASSPSPSFRRGRADLDMGTPEPRAPSANDGDVPAEDHIEKAPTVSTACGLLCGGRARPWTRVGALSHRPLPWCAEACAWQPFCALSPAPENIVPGESSQLDGRVS